MYDTMVDDYLTGDAYWVGLEAKIKLGKKFGFIKENFTEEEVKEINKRKKEGLLFHKDNK